MKKKENKFRFSDQIIARILNVIQEAMIAGVDVLDLFRQMQMKPADGDPHELVLTDEYTKVVDKWHAEIVRELEKRRDDSEAEQFGVAEDQGVIYGTGPARSTGGEVVIDTKDIKVLN